MQYRCCILRHIRRILVDAIVAAQELCFNDAVLKPDGIHHDIGLSGTANCGDWYSISRRIQDPSEAMVICTAEMLKVMPLPIAVPPGHDKNYVHFRSRLGLNLPLNASNSTLSLKLTQSSDAYSNLISLLLM